MTYIVFGGTLSLTQSINRVSGDCDDDYDGDDDGGVDGNPLMIVNVSRSALLQSGVRRSAATAPG